MDDAERKDLKEFLDEFVELIDDVLSDEHAHWFPRDLVGPMTRAWRNEASRKIDAIKSAIDAPQNQTAFDEAGLTGDQLKFKLAAWRRAKEAAQKGPLSKGRRNWRQAVLSWLGLALRPLQGALKIANAILESIGMGFPPAHAVSEFKKMLEGLLDLHDGRGPVQKLGSWFKRRFRRS
jgi:hypothetical protein